jgi:Leucine-rich repeat (LRR) protein
VTRLFLFLTAILSLSSCGQYDVSINDRLIYEPPRLLHVVAIPDQALRDCIEQTIVDEHITTIELLTQLNCSQSAIEDLTGLSQLTALERIKLSNNRIRNTMELGRIASLTHIWLDQNIVVDVTPLQSLPKLTLLELEGNPTLQCPNDRRFSGVVSLPSHCRIP